LGVFFEYVFRFMVSKNNLFIGESKIKLMVLGVYFSNIARKVHFWANSHSEVLCVPIPIF